jgi:site-specific DNA-methyltransferase (adenine-specific)
MTNRLYYGDNLEVLRNRDLFPNDSVDLIYLDPPFNSNASYNILFKSPAGSGAEASFEAFDDTWHWGPTAEAAYDDVMTSHFTDLAELLRTMRSFLRDNDMMAYLAMMAVRLIELHRVLKPTGSLYLHCDPTASHYLKLLLDGVFGAEFYRNEITWKRTSTHSDSKTWSRVADIIFFYTKGKTFTWNTPRAAHSVSHIKSKFGHDDGDGRGAYSLSDMTSPNPRPNMMYEWLGFPFPRMGWRYQPDTMKQLHEEGRIWYPIKADGSYDTTKRPRLKRYLDELDGSVMGSIWSDIPPINSQAQERLGYPTQKPLALLERILAASSNEGDVILDPFCGCGTALHAAQLLKRKWIGIDITHLAIVLIEKRLRNAFKESIDFTTEGRPKDLASAQELAKRDKFEFQKWITTEVGGVPWRGGRKGADGGIDGIINFDGFDMAENRPVSTKAIISVKGGQQRGVGMIAELVETIARENAAVGVLLMAALPTREMEARAAAAGFYDLDAHGRFARIQIITLAELFAGKRPHLPNISRVLVGKADQAADSHSPKLL